MKINRNETSALPVGGVDFSQTMYIQTLYVALPD